MAKHTTLKSLFTSIADAIRNKTGDSSMIAADDFPDAINAIETPENEDVILSGSRIIEYTNNRISNVRPYAFYSHSYLQSVHLENAESIGNLGSGESFAECYYLKSVSIPMALSVSPRSFVGCSALSNVYSPKLLCIWDYAFYVCSSLTRLDIGNVTEEYYMTSIGHYAFSKSAIKTLIIRYTLSAFDLNNINAFENTPIANGEGYIYVPRALVEQYKTAENWSTFADQIRALEDYTFDGTITGEFNYSLI